MFFIPVLTMSAAGAAVTDARGVAALGAGALGVTLGAATVGAGLAVDIRATESDFAGVATVGAGIESSCVCATCSDESPSGFCSARLPKHRRSVSGIVNSNPYRTLLVPRDAPCNVFTRVFVAWSETV